MISLLESSRKSSVSLSKHMRKIIFTLLFSLVRCYGDRLAERRTQISTIPWREQRKEDSQPENDVSSTIPRCHQTSTQCHSF